MDTKSSQIKLAVGHDFSDDVIGQFRGSIVSEWEDKIPSFDQDKFLWLTWKMKQFIMSKTSLFNGLLCITEFRFQLHYKIKGNL